MKKPLLIAALLALLLFGVILFFKQGQTPAPEVPIPAVVAPPTGAIETGSDLKAQEGELAGQLYARIPVKLESPGSWFEAAAAVDGAPDRGPTLVLRTEPEADEGWLLVPVATEEAASSNGAKPYRVDGWEGLSVPVELSSTHANLERSLSKTWTLLGNAQASAGHEGEKLPQVLVLADEAIQSAWVMTSDLTPLD